MELATLTLLRQINGGHPFVCLCRELSIMTKDLRDALGARSLPKPALIDPIALFRTLKIRPGSPIKEMWAPQADALREWHAHRESKDVLLQLNTGAGKTLIGLVAAQSLVNETKGKVVYCCATNQLVEQTREKADELGIATATYMRGTWQAEDVFLKGQGPVLTNYAALFNGRSIFARDALAAIVFDDAHTAHDSVRNAFTLDIERRHYPELYKHITQEFKKYFQAASRGYAFDAVTESRDPSTVMMVPMFEAARHAEDFVRHLLDHGVEQDSRLMFAWAHLGAQLNQCVVLFDQHTVQFTPLLPPVHKMRAFRSPVRRLYLSATLRVNHEFIRTFGRELAPVIAPGGRAGDTERLFLTPPREMTDAAAQGWAENNVNRLKAIIMVPTRSMADLWKGTEIFSSDAGHDRIREFAASKDEHLVLVARYDGIDLPDDDCRVMIVHGVPGGLSLLDRFFEHYLERVGIADAKIASRLVQLLGRTSRGMSDYGVVLLVGRSLLSWILPPAHRALLPEYIQRQLATGEAISGIKGITARELIAKCLNQADDWRAAYEQMMDETKAESTPSAAENERDKRFALAERAAAEALWDGDPERAVKKLASVLTEAFKSEQALGAWLAHWQAYASQLAGDSDAASTLYREAARAKRELGALPETAALPPASNAKSYSRQAGIMALLLQDRHTTRVARELEEIASNLSDDQASAGLHEEAIKMLGEFLGYEASRPEKTTAGKGPDDLWIQPEGSTILLFDAKTKKISTQYNKDLIGQSAQHALWAAAKFPDSDRLHYLVGPRVPATPQATAPPGIRVVAPEELARIATATAAIYQRAADRNLPLFYAAEIEIGLSAAGLTWALLPRTMETVRLDNL